ncbi:MAG: ABC transporter permease [Verrucomicrobiales bacterium]|nr:ABC transporter permease [Verrucomicrobiales bacterium]
MKFALRQLLKSPGFTAVAVLTLALGIGATTALFSVVYGVLISPYPYAKPDEIWAPGVRSVEADETMRPYRFSEFQEMARLSVFSDAMATRPGSVLLTGDYAPETVTGIRVSANAFQFIGVPPLFGRSIQPSDIRSTGEPEPVTVLSYKRWQKLFGGDTNVLGKTLRLDDQLHTIIGVMPPRFGWWTDNGLWLPLGTDPRETRGVFPIMRLKPRVSARVAKEQLDVLQREQAKANPNGFPKGDFTTQLSNYMDITQASGEMQRSLRLLFGAVGLLLLIACGNVANLQLARATSRAREMAIRLAVGAGRGHLVRQLLTESILVSMLGGLLGLLFAFGITRLVVSLMPNFYIPNEARISVNGSVLAFCVVVSVLTGILFGLAPAFQMSRPDLTEALKDNSRGSSGASGGRTRALLVIAEVALSVVLLLSAGLTIRSFMALNQVDLGFRPERVVAVDLPLPPRRYATLEARNRFAQELLQRVNNMPGVLSATIGNGGLPFGGPQSAYAIEGGLEPETRPLTLHAVSSDYLSTLGIPLRKGRMLTGREIDGLERVAVINEAAVKLWPPGEDPIGRRLRLDVLAKPPGSSMLAPSNASAYVTVIGVMGDTRNDGLVKETKPAVLVPYTLLAPPGRTMAIRTQGEPGWLMQALRAEVRTMDAEQPINGPTTFDQIVGFRTAQPRFVTALFSLFASVGLALAMAGIYSVLSYMVSQRTREIGLRIALGAQRRDVVHLILKAGGRLVGLGLVVGILAGLGAARVLNSQLELYKVTNTDPISFLGVLGLIGLVGAAACFIPARRATRIDPLEALRVES